MEKKQFLEEIKRKVYLGEISESEIYIEVSKAKEDILKDKQTNCKHIFVSSSSVSYYYELCSKCGIYK